MPLVAVEHGSGQCPGSGWLFAGRIAQDRGEGGGEIADVRRVMDVAEIYETGDDNAIAGILPDAGEDVGQGDVTVVEASRERARRLDCRRQARQQASERPTRSAQAVDDARLRQCRRGAAHVPVKTRPPAR